MKREETKALRPSQRLRPLSCRVSFFTFARRSPHLLRTIDATCASCRRSRSPEAGAVVRCFFPHGPTSLTPSPRPPPAGARLRENDQTSTTTTTTSPTTTTTSSSTTTTTTTTTTTEAPRRARLFTEGGRLMLHGDDVVLHVGEDIGKGKRPGPVCSA